MATRFDHRTFGRVPAGSKEKAVKVPEAPVEPYVPVEGPPTVTKIELTEETKRGGLAGLLRRGKNEGDA